MDNAISKNIKYFLGYVAFSRALFYLPVFVLFYSSLGIDYSMIMLLFTFFSLVKVVLEIPTGSLADTIGRKNNLLISMVLRVASIVLLIVMAYRGTAADALGYGVLVLATVLFSLGEVLESGASTALIYDYLKAEGVEDKFKEVAAKSSSLIFMAMSISGVIGGLLYKLHTALPYILSFVALTVSLVYVLRIDEGQGFKQKDKSIKTGKKNIVDSVKFVFGQKEIRGMMFFGSVLFTFFMLANWQLQIYFKQINIDVLYFGAVFFVFNMVSSFFSKRAPRIEEKIGLKNSILFIPFALGILFILSGMISNVFGIFVGFGIFALWGYSVPVFSHFMNQYLPSETRATSISVQAFIRGGIYGVISPIIGFFVDKFSIYMALYITGFVVILLLVPLLKTVLNLAGKKVESVQV